MANDPIYLNNLAAGPGYAGYVNVYQPRQYKGKGDPSYDIQVILPPEVGQAMNNQAYEWARAWFTEAEWQSQAFHWPAKLINATNILGDSMQAIVEKFPGWYLLGARRAGDRGQPAITDVQGKPLPPNQRIGSGNYVMLAIDFGTYRESASNFGISVKLGQVCYLTEGVPLALGSNGARLDADMLRAAQAAAANAPRPPGMAPGMAPAPGQGQGGAPYPGGMPQQAPYPGQPPAQGGYPAPGAPYPGGMPQQGGYPGGVPPINPQAPGGMPPGNGNNGGFSW